MKTVTLECRISDTAYRPISKEAPCQTNSSLFSKVWKLKKSLGSFSGSGAIFEILLWFGAYLQSSRPTFRLPFLLPSSR
jgi:hypothetical protein